MRACVFLVTQTICMSGTNENERQCQMAELIVVKHGRSISVTHIFEFKRIYDKISRNRGTRGKRKKTNLNVASMAMVTKWLRIRLESRSVSCNKAGMWFTRASSWLNCRLNWGQQVHICRLSIHFAIMCCVLKTNQILSNHTWNGFNHSPLAHIWIFGIPPLKMYVATDSRV